MDRKLYLVDIRLQCELKPESRKTIVARMFQLINKG